MSEKKTCFWWKFLDGMILQRLSAKCLLHTRTMLFGHILAAHVHPNASRLLPVRFHMESMNGKALEKYLCVANLTNDGFSHTKTVVGWCDTKTKPKGYPSIHERTRIFLEGGNQTWCKCCIGNFGGISLKNSAWSYEVLATQIISEFSPPNLGKMDPSWLRRNIFFRWVGKKHPATRFGLVSYNEEAIRIFWGEVACYLRLLQCRSWTFMVSTVFLDHQRRWCSKRRCCRWLIPLMATRNPAFNSTHQLKQR